MTTRELLENYYKEFAKKGNWDALLSDDFKCIGGDMTHTIPLIGKEAYKNVIQRFSQLFTAMRVKRMIVEGDSACVIGNYDYVFPNGKHINGDVAETWEAKEGKLSSLTIFFDTYTFQLNTK